MAGGNTFWKSLSSFGYSGKGADKVSHGVDPTADGSKGYGFGLRPKKVDIAAMRWRRGKADCDGGLIERVFRMVNLIASKSGVFPSGRKGPSEEQEDLRHAAHTRLANNQRIGTDAEGRQLQLANHTAARLSQFHTIAEGTT